MSDDRIIAPVQLAAPTQTKSTSSSLRDEGDLLNEEHLRRMDQVLPRRNPGPWRITSRKLSLELKQFVHLYTPEAKGTAADREIHGHGTHDRAGDGAPPHLLEPDLLLAFVDIPSRERLRCGQLLAAGGGLCTGWRFGDGAVGATTPFRFGLLRGRLRLPAPGSSPERARTYPERRGISNRLNVRLRAANWS